MVYPADPFWVPSEPQKEALRKYILEEVCPLREDEYCSTFEEPSLLGSIEKSWVGCPSCRTRLRLFSDDYEPTEYWHWWSQICYLPGTSATVMPCCGRVGTLLELTFSDGDSYARFFVGASEPDCGNAAWQGEPVPSWLDQLKPEAVARAEAVFGASIKQLWIFGT